MNQARNTFLGVLALIAVIGIGAIVTSTRPATSTNSSTGSSTGSSAGVKTARYTVQTTSGAQEQTVELTPVSVDAAQGARFVIGKADAPFTLVEFADYQCPACGIFATLTEPQFKTEFVDTGKVRYIYRDFPLQIHANARPAARAAACAAQQDRFELMKAILFRTQRDWSNSPLEQAKGQFKELAGNAGINAQTFGTCLESDQYDAAIQSDYDLGVRVGLTGTPSFVVNGYLFSGGLPIEGLRAALEAAGVQ
jgi:protein-disulfide isomerase